MTTFRKSRRKTLRNEIGGTAIAIITSPNKNIRKIFTPEYSRISTGALFIFLSAPATRTMRPSNTKNFDEPIIPVIRVAIQTSEKNKAEIAVIGSITSLCSSVKDLFQDGG
jgi:hypothetical protein